MKIFALSLSLLWRTVVVYLLLALPIVFLGFAGIDLQPVEQQSAVIYIKAKPSFAFVAFAVVIFLSDRVLNINFYRALWGRKLKLLPTAWFEVTKGTACLFLVLATMNALVAATASVETWITYKLFGSLSVLIFGHFIVATWVYRTHSAHTERDCAPEHAGVV